MHELSKGLPKLDNFRWFQRECLPIPSPPQRTTKNPVNTTHQPSAQVRAIASTVDLNKHFGTRQVYSANAWTEELLGIYLFPILEYPCDTALSPSLPPSPNPG